MTTLQFTRATKTKAKLRMALDGPSGSGKTFTGLTFALALAGPNGKVAVIDTERGSASKYADLFAFDTLELTTFAPALYVEAIKAAEDAGYDVILIDSLSHAWEGEGGLLEMHEQATLREPGRNSYTAWRTITPEHRKLVDAMLQSKCHVIATMRSKMDYLQVEGENGRKVIKKVGMAPIQRQGMEYEFDIVADMDVDHNMIISKSRCFAVADATENRPTAQWFAKVAAWLNDGSATIVVTPPTGKSDDGKGKNGNGNGETKTPARPADPETVKGWLTTKAAKGGPAVAKDGLRGSAVGALNMLFAADDPDAKTAKRHALTVYFFNVEHSEMLTDGECEAILAWATTKTPNGVKANEYAAQEAAKIIEALTQPAQA